MLSLLSSTLAPDVPAVNDFRHHWNSFLKYYDCGRGPPDPERSSRPVESTHQIHHLTAMMKLLAREQKDASSSAAALHPCMEYLVHHQVLDILSTLCQADVPPGIRPHLIKFFTFLVGHIDQVVLPYVSIYLPIRRLLALFCSAKASPTEPQELAFILSLIGNLNRNPELLTLLAHQPSPGDVSHSTSRRVSRASSTLELSILPFLEKETERASQPLINYDGKHLLLSAVLNFVDSADYMVSCQAMDALITVSAFGDDDCAYDAVTGTALCDVTTGRLSAALDALDDAFSSDPFNVSHVEEIKVSWIEAHHLLAPQGRNNKDFAGKTELVAFFSWLDFCDDMIGKSHPVIRDSLVEAVEVQFFQGKFETCLWQDDKSGIHHLRLSILTQIWSHINSDGLASAFTRWMFADSPVVTPEVPQMSFKRKLLAFCMAFDEAVSIEALRLFDFLLERPCQPVLESLVLNNLQGRAYYLDYSPESMNSWSDEEDEREKIRRVSTSPPRSSADQPLYGSRTLAPANVSKVINKWLFLYPDELKCTNDDDVSSTYEQYVVNAEAQVKAVFEGCEGFDWPSEAVSASAADRPLSTTSSSGGSSKPEAERPVKSFYEGDFLSMLFDMVEGMLETSYDVNLQLTAILSKLAQLPHPNVHEYLLNPTIPLIEDQPRTLYSSLRTVLCKAKEASAQIPNLQKKIFACKRNLLGSPQVVSSPMSDDKPELSLNESETKLIDAVIILEEFCKELAAITLVKYNAVAVA